MAHMSDMRVIRGDSGFILHEGTPQHVPADGPERHRQVREPRHARVEQRKETFLEGCADGLRRLAGFVSRHAVPLAVIATLTLAIVMLYAPMRDWYVSMRSNQDLAAYYAALDEQRDDLSEDLSRLQTREGIEDEARKRGYINPDETGVLVENLPVEDLEMGDEIQVSYETTWNVALLDFVFGYTAGEWK